MQIHAMPSCLFILFSFPVGSGFASFHAQISVGFGPSGISIFENPEFIHSLQISQPYLILLFL